MNKQLEERLKEVFENWRKQHELIENQFMKGILTLEECLGEQHEAIRNAGCAMFAAVHQESNW